MLDARTEAILFRHSKGQKTRDRRPLTEVVDDDLFGEQ